MMTTEPHSAEPGTVQRLCVLGAGSAGLLAALTLKRKLPHLDVLVVRSPEIGIIGVGEGTTNAIPKLLFEHLGLKPYQFYEMAQPTWKMGLKLLWGPRPEFFYSFGIEFTGRPGGQGEYSGAYCLEGEEVPLAGEITATMAAGKCFPRSAHGTPAMHGSHAYHIENRKFVAWLETVCLAIGVEIRDGTMSRVESTGETVHALHLESGERIAADLFIDASGFRSEIVGRHFGVPWRDFGNALFCDRAVIGFWDRSAEEPVLPYTTVETMNSGWCWRIEHERVVNRGYVYSSRFISDDEARAEYQAKNPKAPAEPRVVKFRTGCLEKAWVGNVVAVGNAVGFVEPLEATALQVLAQQCVLLTGSLIASECRPTATMRDLHNKTHTLKWNAVRDFLACHYAFNTRLDTTFWKHCRNETPLGEAAEFVKFYQENGVVPDAAQLLLDPLNAFGAEGHLTMLIGQRVPAKRRYQFSAAALQAWRAQQQKWRTRAQNAMTVEEGLAAIRKQPGAWKHST